MRARRQVDGTWLTDREARGYRLTAPFAAGWDRGWGFGGARDMSLLMMRAAILAQGGANTGTPVDIGSAWELDATRTPAGYTLSDGNQTAINTSGGNDYRRWVPSAKALWPTDGRYWEVLCADSGSAEFNGYLGVVSAEQRDDYDAGDNPITLGSIGYRGNGTLWSPASSAISTTCAT